MSDILPPVIPPVIPSLSGPALSYSSVRKVTDATGNLLDSLQASIRSSVSSGLAAAAREGIRLETKVTDKLGKQLTPPEQLIDHVTSLVQNSLAGSLAQAVQTFEDLTIMGGSSGSQRDVTLGDISQPESFVYNPAQSQASTPSAAPMRATVASAAVPGPAGRATSRTISSINGGGPRPGPQDIPACPIPSQQEQARLQALGQAAADATPPTMQDRITGVVGNWWSLTDDCCVLGPDRNPGALSLQTPKPHWQVGIDGGPDQAIAGFKVLQAAWNTKGLACGTPPLDCKTHPTDPACIPPGNGHDTCPQVPCDVTVTCPPPVINVPPCPPVDFNLPSCIQIDLCDWDKFCEFIKKCLVQAKEDCALDNETAYTYTDCGGRYGDAQDYWLGTLANGVSQQNTVDDINALAQQLPAALTADNFGPLQPY